VGSGCVGSRAGFVWINNLCLTDKIGRRGGGGGVEGAQMVQLLRVLSWRTRRSLKVFSVWKSLRTRSIIRSQNMRHQSSPISTGNKSKNRFAASTVANHHRWIRQIGLKFKAQMFALFFILTVALIVIKITNI